MPGCPPSIPGDQVAITAANAAGVRAYFFNGQAVPDIGTLGEPSAFATALSDAGQITGGPPVRERFRHAFLLREAGQVACISTTSPGRPGERA